MADTMQFDLVSPERSLASMQAVSVQLPGSEGDMTAMPDHSPVITTLRPGVVRVAGPDGEAAFVVTGGFAEIKAEGLSVLAERAMPVGDVTQNDLDGFVTEAVKARENATPEIREKVTKQVADIAAMASDIGMSVNTDV